MRRSVKRELAVVAGLVFLIMFIFGPNSARTEQPAKSRPEGGNVKTLAIDPVNPAIIYAGTFGGVFKGNDDDANWFALNQGLTR